MEWLSILVGVTAVVVAARWRARARLPRWLRHALALGFTRDRSTHISASRGAKPLVRVGYLPNRAEGIGREDSSQLLIEVQVQHAAGVQIVADSGTEARAKPETLYIAPFAVSYGTPAKQARALLDEISPVASSLSKHYRLVFASSIIGTVTSLDVGVVVPADIERDGLRAAVEAAERLAERVTRFLRKLEV